MVDKETNNNLTAESFFGGNKIASPSQVNNDDLKEELRQKVLEQYLNLAATQMEETQDVKARLPFWKRPAFLIGGLAALALFVLGAVLIYNSTGTGRQPAILKGEVAYTEGNVLYSAPDGKWQTASANLLIEQGMSLKVEGNGKAIISLDDGSSVRMNSNTQVTLTSMDPKHIVVANDKGEVYTRVAQADRKFDVLVNDVTFQAMGTAYRTLCLDDRAGVEVYESQVKILGISDNNEILVQQGEQFYLVNMNKPDDQNKVTPVDMETLKQDDFVLWNKAQDEKINEFKSKLGILFDIMAPFINLASPLENTTKLDKVIVSGTTEKNAKIYINDVETPNNNGSFSYELVLAMGDNIIQIKIIDIAGNKTIKTLVLTRMTEDITPTDAPAPTQAGGGGGGNNNAAIALSGANVGNGIKLNWTITNTDAPSGFKVIKADHSNPVYPGDDYQYLSDSGVRSYTWNIINGLTYHFRVCKYNGSGACLLYSNDITVTAPYVEPTVEPVPSVAFSLATWGSDGVHWTVTSGSSPHGFKVIWSKSHNPTYPADNCQYHSGTGSGYSNTLGDWDGYGTYYVRVCAYDGSGHCYASLYSNEVSLTLGTPPATPTPTVEVTPAP